MATGELGPWLRATSEANDRVIVTALVMDENLSDGADEVVTMEELLRNTREELPMVGSMTNVGELAVTLAKNTEFSSKHISNDNEIESSGTAKKKKLEGYLISYK